MYLAAAARKRPENLGSMLKKRFALQSLNRPPKREEGGSVCRQSRALVPNHVGRRRGAHFERRMKAICRCAKPNSPQGETAGSRSCGRQRTRLVRARYGSIYWTLLNWAPNSSPFEQTGLMLGRPRSTPQSAPRSCRRVYGPCRVACNAVPIGASRPTAAMFSCDFATGSPPS